LDYFRNKNKNTVCFLLIDHDRLRLEQDYLVQQQMMMSKSATLNEMMTFKKEFDKSERQREQLSDHLEVN
jgi:hypothetical protein